MVRALQESTRAKFKTRRKSCRANRSGTSEKNLIYEKAQERGKPFILGQKEPRKL